jgi:hypothetical protein
MSDHWLLEDGGLAQERGALWDIEDGTTVQAMVADQAISDHLQYLSEKPVLRQLAEDTDRSESVNEFLTPLYTTIDMHQGQELAGGRTIGSPVKPLRIGPCAPTRSSAVPSIGQRVAPA